MEREVGAVLERSQMDGRRNGRIDDDRCRMRDGRDEIRHREVRVRGRFEPDELDPVRRRPRLVELNDADAPPLEGGERDPSPVVAPAGERDRVARLEQREDERRRRAGAGGEEEGRAAVQLPERGLGGGDGRVAESLVVEVARLAALVVRPHRRAVEGLHRADPTRVPVGARRADPSAPVGGTDGARRLRPRSSRPLPRPQLRPFRSERPPRPTRTLRARSRR